MARCRFIECRRTIARESEGTVTVLTPDGVTDGAEYSVAGAHDRWVPIEDGNPLDSGHPGRDCEPLIAVTVELHPGQVDPESGDLDWSWCDACSLNGATFLVAGEVGTCVECLQSVLEKRLTS